MRRGSGLVVGSGNSGAAVAMAMATATATHPPAGSTNGLTALPAADGARTSPRTHAAPRVLLSAFRPLGLSSSSPSPPALPPSASDLHVVSRKPAHAKQLALAAVSPANNTSTCSASTSFFSVDRDRDNSLPLVTPLPVKPHPHHSHAHAYSVAHDDPDHAHTHRPLPPQVVSCLLVIWFGACLVSAVTNKRIMTEFNSPSLLTSIHLLTGLLIDAVLIHSRRIVCPLNRSILLYAIPVAVSLCFGKTLTFVSYAKVPASLTHTVKASAPVFSVLLARLTSSRLPSVVSCLALAPIAVGVTLSAVSEVEFQLVGFLSAAAATFLGVLQSTVTKLSMQRTAVEPLVFHLYTSAAAFVFTLPGMLAETHSLLGVYAAASPSPSSSPLLDHSTALSPSPSPSPSAAAAAGSALSVPWLLVVLSLATHYLQNISSIYVLAQCNLLSHQVASTFKRLVVIFGSVLYFGNPITLLNALGMATALAGFFLYGMSRHYRDRYPKRGRGSFAAASASSASSSLSAIMVEKTT